MSATSSSFFRTGVGDAGETITTSVLASRCDSSPVISLAPHRPDLNGFWIEAIEHHHRAKATA